MSTRPPKLRDHSLKVETKPAPGRARTASSRWHSLTWWAHHHLLRDTDGEFAPDPNGWGTQGKHDVTPRSRKSYRERQREIERDNHAAAKEAQDRRAEDHEAHDQGKRGKRERADFWGHKNGSYNPRAERRVRGGGTAARERYEAEQADADRRRRKG